jgi:hypothetical protein
VDCTGGLLSVTANCIADFLSAAMPVVISGAKGIVVALVAVVPLLVLLLLAGRDESRKLAAERRGTYHQT